MKSRRSRLRETQNLASKKNCLLGTQDFYLQRLVPINCPARATIIKRLTQTAHKTKALYLHIADEQSKESIFRSSNDLVKRR
jgi:hypothetical protein